MEITGKTTIKLAFTMPRILLNWSSHYIFFFIHLRIFTIKLYDGKNTFHPEIKRKEYGNIFCTSLFSAFFVIIMIFAFSEQVSL